MKNKLKDLDLISDVLPNKPTNEPNDLNILEKMHRFALRRLSQEDREKALKEKENMQRGITAMLESIRESIDAEEDRQDLEAELANGAGESNV